jgi:hypothetical protein
MGRRRKTEISFNYSITGNTSFIVVLFLLILHFETFVAQLFVMKILKRIFLFLDSVTYTIVQSEKGYRVLKDKVILLHGMQLRFLHDLRQNLVPDLDMILLYFPSLHEFQELITLGLITVRPQRIPGPGEKTFLISAGFLYYSIRASVFTAELTEKGDHLLAELAESELFSECMIEMDKKIAEILLKKEM